MRWCACMLGLLWPVIAAGRPVFYDDFDGGPLLHPWAIPPASHWQYNVSNSMLNVTGLFYPSVPNTGGNWSIIAAAFAPQADFRADIWMGWEPGDPPHELEFRVNGVQGQVIASSGYRKPGGPSSFVYAVASNQGAFVPAPPPGIHQFTVSRTGTQLDFLLNGSAFASFQDLSGLSARVVSIRFLGPYPGTLGTLHVDRVIVVPVPGAVVIAVPLLACARRRR